MFPTEGIVYIDGQVLLGQFLATEEEGRIKAVTQARKRVWNQTRKDLDCETGEFGAHLTGNGEFLKKLRWGAMLAELHCFLRKQEDQISWIHSWNRSE